MYVYLVGVPWMQMTDWYAYYYPCHHLVNPQLLLGIGPDCHNVRVGITLQEGSLGVGQR